MQIYTVPTCPHCNELKKWLKENNVEFTAYDVSENEEKAEEMKEKSGQMRVPVIDIEGEILVGFDESVKNKLKEKLSL